MVDCRDVEISLADGQKLPAALALVPDASGPRPGVLILHEVLGLNDDMRRIAGRLAGAGYVSLAPDFLAGLGPKPFCIARFARGLARPGRGRPYRQLDGARRWLAARPEVSGRAIGVAGFCIGGGFALLYAAGAEVQVVASFYGAVPVDGTALEGICPVVASYGGRDRVFGPQAARLEAALTRSGVEHDVRVYPDAGHSFLSQHGGLMAGIGSRTPLRVGYAEPAAEDSWARMLAFFDHHLGGPTRAAG
jgi:carboxymethylenebutenolidase